MRYSLIFLLLISPLFLPAQNYCICGKSKDLIFKNPPDTVFRLSHEFEIAVCGFRERIYGITCYAEFSITICGQQHALRTFSALEYYLLETIGDTFVMSEMKLMPTGENLEFRLEPWSFTKLYMVRDSLFNENLLVWVEEINPYIKLATETEIKFINQKLIEAKKNKTLVNSDILGLVFYGAFSGDEFLEKEFTKLPEYFSIDGADKLWHEELKVMMDNWNVYLKQIVE